MIKVINKSWEISSEYIQNNSIDLFFCDPPYYGVVSDEWDNQWNDIDEYFEWTKQWMELTYSQLKNTGTMYVCIHWKFSGIYRQILDDIGFYIRNRITWKRDKGRGSKTNWKSMHEDIWFVTKGKDYTFNISDVMIEKKVLAPYRDKDGNPKDWWYNKDGNPVRLTYPGNIWTDLCVPFWSSKEVRSYAKTKEHQIIYIKNIQHRNPLIW